MEGYNMEIINFVEESMIIVVAALYVLGILLKNSRVKDELIPWILILIGLVVSMWMNGINPDSFIQGILVTGAAVLANNLIKQTSKFNSQRK